MKSKNINPQFLVHKVLCAFFILSFSAAHAKAPSYDNRHKESVHKFLNSYNNDEARLHAVNMLNRFESGIEPNAASITNMQTAGIVFVLNSSTDCSGSDCNDMRICGAAIDVLDKSIGYMGLKDESPKRPLPEYVTEFLAGNDVSGSREAKFASRGNLPTSYPKYTSNGKEWVTQETSTSQSFIRQSGEWLIIVSTTSRASDVLIFAFRVNGMQSDTSQNKAQFDDIQGYSKSTIQYLTELKENERDRNEFSEMIETIVNHAEVTPYYHNNQMFILADGLFRVDLEVKCNGRDMWILASALPDIKNYVRFTSNNYDGDTDHDVRFSFEIPTEGMYGLATFKYQEEKWVLTNIDVLE